MIKSKNTYTLKNLEKEESARNSEILNTDQGSQFTSEVFIQKVLEYKIFLHILSGAEISSKETRMFQFSLRLKQVMLQGYSSIYI